jgi:FixJ family two-component response regulator
MDKDPMVLLLDDDPALVASVERLLKVHGYQVRSHTRVDDFFQAGLPSVPACLLLDNQLGNGLSGVQVHEEILRRGWFMPTVFLTGSWDVRMVVKVMRDGADGFLTKPFDPTELLAEVAKALQRAKTGRQDAVKVAGARARAATLTPRERQIVVLVVDGLLNKEIADRLKLALVTVKVYRASAMAKLGAGNSSELAHLAALAGIVRLP